MRAPRAVPFPLARPRPLSSLRRSASRSTSWARARIPTVLLPLLLLGRLDSAEGEPFSATEAGDLKERVIWTNDRLTILTPAALVRFEPVSEAWTLIEPSDGLPDPPLRGFSQFEDQFWIAGEGAALTSPRFDAWQTFKRGDSPPCAGLIDIEADDEYAFAGGELGAARFDQYIREWEVLAGPDGRPLGPVRDLVADDERVWFALEGGVAEYRKDTQSVRVDSILGEFRSPAVLAMRQTTRHLWALTRAGLARYDKELRSWSSYAAGRDLPDARVHEWILQGDDVWLGTDEGLWQFQNATGIWRRHPAMEGMPGEKVVAFALEPDRIWTVTDEAIALYENAAARWIDFTPVVPLPREEIADIAFSGGTLVLAGRRAVACGLPRGQTNPSLYLYAVRSLPEGDATPPTPERRWGLGLDERGATLEMPGAASMQLGGGATIFIEDDDYAPAGAKGIERLTTEERLDLSLSGRFGRERTLTGRYDTTDPENPAYQLTYRGSRDDNLRTASVGEIEQEIYNSRLTPGTGLRGGSLRLEAGPRSTERKRRLVTADAWAGERRTRPGRDVFYGGNRSVTSRLRDVDYLRRRVYALPDLWTDRDLAGARLYKDDNDPETDGVNTEVRELAGIPGAWDLMEPIRDYSYESDHRRLLLAVSLGDDDRLVLVRTAPDPPTPADRLESTVAFEPRVSEMDLTGRSLRNVYSIGVEIIPGSLSAAILDSTGSDTDSEGTPHLRLFGLDSEGDGEVDRDRLSLLSGLLAFPDSLPFPAEVYADPPRSAYTLSLAYETRLSAFRLTHSNVVPGSERITLDREPLRADVDYSIIPSSGLFVFFEGIVLEDDSVIEVEYDYEVAEESADLETETVVSGQVGLAPGDLAFAGLSATRWTDEKGAVTAITGINSRIETKGDDSFLRLSPEAAWSRAIARADDGTGAGGSPAGRDGWAAGASLQARRGSIEITGSHRRLGERFTSFEDRRTLLGRLRDESEAAARWSPSARLQTEVNWARARSDSAEGAGLELGGRESSFTGKVRLLRSGLPNLEIRRGRVRLDTPRGEQEKWITRAEVEISPEQAGVRPRFLRRVWLRSFFQRSERRGEILSPGSQAASRDSLPRDEIADTFFARLNGSTGNPVSWNVAFEARRSSLPRPGMDTTQDQRQSLDATLQSQAHPSLDLLLRMESERELFADSGGEDLGHQTRRTFSGSGLIYPGRISRRLTPLSFRVEVGGDETGRGEAGDRRPGAEFLWGASWKPRRLLVERRATMESRLQVFSWLRWIERLEHRSESEEREPLRSAGVTRLIETRMEAKPSAGLLTLRAILERSERGEQEESRRFVGQWDQGWGRGFLTYLALEGRHEKMNERNLRAQIRDWTPEARLSWRRSRWQTDASIGVSLNWNRSEDASLGAASKAETKRRAGLTTSLSVQPVKILTLKLRHLYSFTKMPAAEAGSFARDEDHDFRVTVLLRS